MAKSKPLPSREDLLKAFRYDPETGFLWRVGKLNRKPAGWRDYHHRDGSPAAINVRFNDRSYMAHRIAWRIMTGEDPGNLTVDHIDRDPFNNKWENLRLADQSLQNQNRKGYGVSPHKGAYFNKNASKWFASARVNGKQRNLGYFATEEEAAAAAAPYFIH